MSLRPSFVELVGPCADGSGSDAADEGGLTVFWGPSRMGMASPSQTKADIAVDKKGFSPRPCTNDISV